MITKSLSKQSAALAVCRELRSIGELDDNMYPAGKDRNAGGGGGSGGLQYDGHPNFGSTKRRRYYYKLTAPALTSNSGQLQPESGRFRYRLYSLDLRLVCPIPDDQNTRGRRIFNPEDSRQSFGFLVTSELPALCPFPIYTRSGEVIVDVVMLEDELYLNEEEQDLILRFHNYTFSQVLRLEKFPMVFSPEKSENSVFCLPLSKKEGGSEKCIDWPFLRSIRDVAEAPRLRGVSDSDREGFEFNEFDYSDAVVMPWYRNKDQPQYFYVAEICRHLSPKYDYSFKYSLRCVLIIFFMLAPTFPDRVLIRSRSTTAASTSSTSRTSTSPSSTLTTRRPGSTF
jgi:endoribonuclease Dicer